MEGKINLLPALIAAFLFSLTSFAQQNIIDDIEALIKAGKIAQAENLTNRYLVDDPVNVDLLMMKGNVLLNQYIIEQQAQLSLRPNYDESIYNVTTLEKGPHPVTVEAKTADRVAKLWKAAATLEPTREDMHLGLCQVYAISGKQEELLAYLPTVKEKVLNVEDLHLHLVTYARNLQERNDRDGAILVYKKIAGLFPEQIGLLSDIGAEYFFAGELDSAKYYIGRSVTDENASQAVLGNSIFFNTFLGNYDKALEAFIRLPGNGNLLYEGILKFYRNEKKWQKPIEKFLRENPDSSEAIAAKILTDKSFKLSMDIYLQLAELDLGDPIKLLIHQKFKEMGDFLPAFNAAETYCYNRHYVAAINLFQEIENGDYALDGEDRELFNFYYAWALWNNDRKEASVSKWEQLFDASDFYKKSAAYWFVGKYYYDLGEKSKGREFFAEMAGNPSASKYATMCWDYMSE